MKMHTAKMHTAGMKMHIDEKWLDPDTWQRVVDGELSRAELRELVCVCEQHPQFWKCCAVAFLEEQTLTLELQELAGKWPATPADVIDGQNSLRKQNRLQPIAATSSKERGASYEPRAAVAKLPKAKPSSPAHSDWLNHLALAASVVLAFLIGWQAAERFGGNKQLNLVSEANENAAAGNTSIAKHTLPAPSAAENVNQADAQLGDWTSTDTDSGDIALLDAMPSAAIAADAIEQALQRPEQFVPLDRGIPKQLADLEQRGLVRIESIEGFVPVRLRDGKTAVVPVQQIELRPVRKTY